MTSLRKWAIESNLPGMTSLGKLLSKKVYEHPILVVGVGRSGTSILRESLGQHRNVLSARREVPLFQFVAEVAYQLAEGPKADHFQYCCRIPVHDMKERLRRMTFEICWGPNYGIAQMLRRWCSSPIAISRKSAWVARTFPDEKGAVGLRVLFPHIKFVHIHRDGVEVVASRMKYEAFRDDPFESHCEEWARSSERYRYMKDLDCAITITHSQLVEQRDQVFSRILDFVGLPPDDAPTRFAESTVMIPREIPRAAQKLDTGVEALLKKRPPSYLEWTNSQRSAFKRICGHAMDELGYKIPF